MHDPIQPTSMVWVSWALLSPNNCMYFHHCNIFSLWSSAKPKPNKEKAKNESVDLNPGCCLWNYNFTICRSKLLRVCLLLPFSDKRWRASISQTHRAQGCCSFQLMNVSTTQKNFYKKYQVLHQHSSLPTAGSTFLHYDSTILTSKRCHHRASFTITNMNRADKSSSNYSRSQQ